MTSTAELTARRIALGRALSELGHQIETGTVEPYIAMAELEILHGRIEVCLAEIDVGLPQIPFPKAPLRCSCQLSFGPAEHIPDELHDDDCELRPKEAEPVNA